ncbi:DUF5753 domain-containing protein [Streptomyces sp. NPDC005897]|uniref:DUF5753 domain-containing protein n=1 Tax=Streptomyces sp. NPDC005897 TaxID=3157081 RepID=UPI00340071E7
MWMSGWGRTGSSSGAVKARRVGIAPHFADVAELEKPGRTIEDWAPALVPGLLQTWAYATAIARSAMPRASDAEVEEVVKARLDRAELFERDSPPKFWAIIDESVIRRRVLPSAGMAELLDHIADAQCRGTSKVAGRTFSGAGRAVPAKSPTRPSRPRPAPLASGK